MVSIRQFVSLSGRERNWYQHRFALASMARVGGSGHAGKTLQLLYWWTVVDLVFSPLWTAVTVVDKHSSHWWTPVTVVDCSVQKWL